MDNDKGRELLEKYNNGGASEQEQALVEKWYASTLFSAITNSTEKDLLHYDRIKSEIWSNIQIPETSVHRIRTRWLSIAVAIALFLSMGIAGYYYYQHPNTKQDWAAKSDIRPGSTGATLTLANGQRIALNEARQGELSQQAGISIRKTKDGLLVYEISTKNLIDQKEYINTLSTARGESFLMVLPDKSKVWLNADSRLVYDANMNQDNTRAVELIGEAYFEVAKSSTPFIVKTNKQQVKVLGTTFNIKAYQDDDVIKTTLIEGKVNVKSGTNEVLLAPGEMSVVADHKLIKRQVDVSEETAWRDGNFVFASERLSEILQVIGRWYAIDFVFVDKQLQSETFEAMFPRTTELKDILDVLESTGKVKFEIVNRTAYVKKN